MAAIHKIGCNSTAENATQKVGPDGDSFVTEFPWALSWELDSVIIPIQVPEHPWSSRLSVNKFLQFRFEGSLGTIGSDTH